MNLALFFEGMGQGVRGKKTNVSLVYEVCLEDAVQRRHLEAGSGAHVGALVLGKTSGVGWRVIIARACRWYEAQVAATPSGAPPTHIFLFGFSRDVATRLVGHMYRTYRDFAPHTIWECYSPTEPKPATNKRGEFVRHDFCGWSALGPISIFLEDVIGIKEANAFTNALRCDFPREVEGRVGVENYRFGRVTCSVIATTDAIRVVSNRPFTLFADGREFAVKSGENVFSRRNTLEAGFRDPPIPVALRTTRER